MSERKEWEMFDGIRIHTQVGPPQSKLGYCVGVLILFLVCLGLFVVPRFAPNLQQTVNQYFKLTEKKLKAVISTPMGNAIPTVINGSSQKSVKQTEVPASTPFINEIHPICPEAIEQRLRVNSNAIVCTKSERLNVHTKPGLSGSVVKSLDLNTTLKVIDGPVCLDNYSWWKISTEDGIEGWVAEGDKSTNTYYVCPEDGVLTNTQASTFTIPTNQRLSPEQFIREYYSLINERQYNKTWAMLSDNFKRRNHCCKPDGSFDASPYKEWWNSIDNVEILMVDTRAQTVDTAIIDITIRYHRKDGLVADSTSTFNLIRDSSGKSWLID